jgi:hypothetical protein
MKNDREIDKEIDKYLANESSSLGDDFTHDLLSRIDQLESEFEPESKNTWLLPFVSLGVAACLVSLFILANLEVNNEVKPSIIAANKELIKNSLEDPEKVILEDLMAVPEEWDVTQTLLSEETYDLLVLLDY